MKKLLLLKLIFVVASCVGQDTNGYYAKCMQSQLKGTGIDFYGRMQDVEDKLLEIRALNTENKEGYLKAFESLLVENDTTWKNHYNILKKTVLKDFDIETVKLPLLSFCSDIQNNERYDLDAKTLNVHRFFLKKLVYKPYDDAELLDGILLFTNFKEESLRLNITYLLLLNLNLKYGHP